MSLPLSKRSLVAYGRLRVNSKEGEGFSEEVWGLLLEYFSRTNMAAFLVLAFAVDTYARGMDWDQLRPQDVSIAGGKVAVTFGVRERGEEAKTGTDQGVVIRREWVAKLMVAQAAKLARRGSPQRFFDITRDDFNDAWAEALSALGLLVVGPPHAMRHAGASIDHLSHGVPLLDVQKRGRWESKKSVSRYSKPHVLVRLNATIPTHMLNKGADFIRQLSAIE